MFGRSIGDNRVARPTGYQMLRSSRRSVTTHRTPFVTCILLCVQILIGQAQSPEATIFDQFAWDYPDELIEEFGIVWFEIRIDGNTAASVGKSSLPGQPGSYVAPVPHMTVGQHLLEVRACTLVSCGTWSAPFLFAHSGAHSLPPAADICAFLDCSGLGLP